MFENLKSAGIIFSLENGNLKIDGPENSIEKWIFFIRENKSKIIENLEKNLHAQKNTIYSDAKETDLSNPDNFTEPTQAEVNSVLCPMYRAVDAKRFPETEANRLLGQLWAAQELHDWKAFRVFLNLTVQKARENS